MRRLLAILLFSIVFITNTLASVTEVSTYPLSEIVKAATRTVSSAGTQVTLTTTSTPCKSVIIKALSTNTGFIYIGGSDCSNTAGYILSAGESISMDIDDLFKIWIDSSVNAEGVSYIAIK